MQCGRVGSRNTKLFPPSPPPRTARHTVRVLSPSSISRLYAPSSCELRTWLKFQGEIDEAPAGPFQKFLQAQGIRHETAVVDRLIKEFPDWVDIDGFENPNAAEETCAAIEAGRDFIYQGQLEYETTELDGNPVRVMGYPDFMTRSEAGYTIGDAKLARSIYETKKDGSRKPKSTKKYIVYQLQLYGWLFSKQFPDLKFDLLVHNGAGGQEAIDIPEGFDEVLGKLKQVLSIEALPEEPWESVGWSKCGVCGFFDHCWPRAQETKALGCVPGIGQPLSMRLHEAGLDSYLELAGIDAATLAGLKSPRANTPDLAPSERILENVQALLSGQAIRRRSAGNLVDIDPQILDGSSFVMFDLEGVPPDLDGWDKIYLWGMQVFGEQKGEFRPAFAGFGNEGDEEGWVEFLRIARELLDEHPAIPFVHWAPYEKTKIKQYMDRYPETDLVTANEVLAALVDLLPITKNAVALPLPSYSLKAVEKLPELVEITGFSRLSEGVGKGDDSIAAYMEAAESGDGARRAELMAQLAAYNQEDLEATWAVQLWLRGLTD